MSTRFPRDTAKRKLYEEDYRRATAHGQRALRSARRWNTAGDVAWGLFIGGVGVGLCALGVVAIITAMEYFSAKPAASPTTPPLSVTFGSGTQNCARAPQRTIKAWSCVAKHLHDYTQHGECVANNSNQEWEWR